MQKPFSLFGLWGLRGSLVSVSVSGMLAMVYIVGIMSPLATDYFRALGAGDLFFGLLGGIPMVVIFLQFPGAFLTNRIRRRKGLFMVLFIIARSMFLVVAFLPQVGLPQAWLLGCILVAIAAHGALSNLGTPMWFSWMADLMPPRVLNTYWGRRQGVMHLTWLAGFMCLTGVTYWSSLGALALYPIVVSVSVAGGVIDILLFVKVREPRNELMPTRRLRDVLFEPLRHREYRRFVAFWSAWLASSLVAANFMQIYALEVLGLDVWQAMLTWGVYGVGSGLTSAAFGRMADRHGHKPILMLCILFKPLIAVVFMLVTPDVAFWVLPLAFFPDGICNAGMMVATNGFMMKLAPRQNRSMFIASIMGLSGIAAGVASILGGQFLTLTSGMEWELLGRIWNRYQVLFGISLLLRLACFRLVWRLEEPKSSRAVHVLNDVFGVWPMRFLRFPTGLYRKYRDPDSS